MLSTEGVKFLYTIALTTIYSIPVVDKSLLSLANTAHVIASSGSEASNTSVSRFCFLCYLST